MTTSPDTTSHDFEVWTTTGGVVVTDPAALDAALDIVRRGLDEIERACSRFRPDSELSMVLRHGGRHRVSPMLADLLATALASAEASNGLVDPTVGDALRWLGYDRSIEQVPHDGQPVRVIRAVPGWRVVRLEGIELGLLGSVLSLHDLLVGFVSWCKMFCHSFLRL